MQDVIVQLQGIQDTKIDTDCDCRRALFNPVDCNGRTGCTLGDLGDAQVPAQPGKFDLLAYCLHLPLEFAGHLRPHRRFAHLFTTLYSVYKYKHFIYFMIY